MSEFQKVPKYVEDTPKEYNSFTGGINNDTNNENIKDHEVRDAKNTHYKNGDLGRRPGAVAIRSLEYIDIHPNEHKNVVQGSFTYVGKYNHYLVVVRDGFVYYSIYGENEILKMIKLHIKVDATLAKYDPLNLIVGLEQFTNESRPNFILDHDGFVLKGSNTLPEDEDVADLWGDGGIEYYSAIVEPEYDRLILQNYKKVQGAVFDDKLYLATGTRYIVLEEKEIDGEVLLTGEIVTPKKVNGFEYTHIGYNVLSPYPNQHLTSTYSVATSRINFIKVEEHTIFVGTGIINVEAIMDYKSGKDEDDYYFLWEYKKPSGDWTVYNTSLTAGKGQNKIVMDLTTETPAAGEVYKIRCTYASELTDTGEIDKAFGEYGSYSISVTVEAGVIADYAPAPAPEFIDIHSCNKLFTDGEQIILYGSNTKAGNWYKTIIKQFGYITQRNSLNFQTTKNERIVACLPLEGNILVFADNPQLGGSIHKVYGNGDDYDAGDGYFSPYKRKVVNTVYSCDHPSSVQFVDNFIMFKYRRQIYMIDSRELNSERLNVTNVSDNINNHQPGVEIPDIGYYEGYEFDVESEITEDYYGIIFTKHNLRWKMYYKMPFSYQGKDKIVYPWLRDETELLNIDGIVEIDGVPTHIYDDQLIQYTNLQCLDLGEQYKTTIVTKAFSISDVNGMVIFINSVLLKFYRGATDILSLDFQLYNEANRLLIGQKYDSFFDPELEQIVWDNPYTYFKDQAEDEDKAALILGQTTLEESKLGAHLYSSKVYRPDLKFPCLSAYATITIDSGEAFALSGLTFDYMSTNLPAKNLPKIYAEIIRKDD